MHQHELELKKYADKKFSELKNIEYYSKPGKFPILFFNLKGLNSQDLAAYLSHKGFIVRSGVSCVKMSPVITKIEGAVRASLYVYNTRKDIDKLVDALKKYKKGAELDHVVF
ncbi:MAG: aminotransferase class V-fold PLP-dependent enzyme [Clostridia bacterium]|nr:aminotransferase class V-fold PLP-dependent enzyme [Clostridia bacterium]